MAALSACSGNGVGLDSNGAPLTGGAQSALTLSADFDSLQANVFTPICSVCHIGASAPEGLMLDAAHSYSLLVGVPSTEVPGLLRVDPGNPQSSYLIQKLEGHAAVGAQMPLDEPPLPAATIADIVQWITDGAQPSSAAQQLLAAEPFAVAALAPEEGASLPQAPSHIVIAFTRELDVTRVSDAAIWLEGGPADAVRKIRASLSVPTRDARALILTPQSPLSPGRYRVLAGEEPGDQLSSLDGTPLAGPDVQPRVLLRFRVGAR